MPSHATADMMFFSDDNANDKTDNARIELL